MSRDERSSKNTKPSLSGDVERMWMSQVICCHRPGCDYQLGETKEVKRGLEDVECRFAKDETSRRVEV
jgi:hypothetical protein